MPAPFVAVASVRAEGGSLADFRKVTLFRVTVAAVTHFRVTGPKFAIHVLDELRVARTAWDAVSIEALQDYLAHDITLRDGAMEPIDQLPDQPMREGACSRRG